MLSEPTRWASTWPLNHRYCWRSSRVAASPENVEKVVRPPRKPVITNSCSSGDTAWKLRNRPIATPISRPPMRFAASVPIGKGGNTGLSSAPSPQRNQQPSAPPTPMATNPFKPMRAS
ncbi:hypothetical protein RLIN73S_07447 [Rhodanobacter lindaniclasticus]